MAPQGSRKGNDTLTKTTFKVGDKVQILNAASILYARQYFNDGDITTVKKVNDNGDRPTLITTTSDGHEGGLYIMGRELPFIKKVEAPAFASKADYQVGDKVRILDVSKILFGEDYFFSGDITTITFSKGDVLAIDRKNGVAGNGLIITTDELPYIEKVVQAEPVLSKRDAKIAAHGYKAGDRMRIIDASNIGGGHQLENGKVYEVAVISEYGNPRILLPGGRQLGIVGSELPYVEKVTESVDDARITILESKVASLAAKVRALETGNVDMIPSSRYPSMAQATPSAFTRAEVIESARQYVEDLTARMYGGRINHEGNSTFRHRTTKPHFKTKGRTVTVVVRGSGLPTEYERASATCAEGDVFNEDIGRAIALGRALGLEVPTAFTKAPQPTQVVVGMEVDTYYAYGGGKNRHCPTTVTGLYEGMPAFGNGSHSSHYKITDDTNAEYGTEAF